jgi:hypothetical protein
MRVVGSSRSCSRRGTTHPVFNVERPKDTIVKVDGSLNSRNDTMESSPSPSGVERGICRSQMN